MRPTTPSTAETPTPESITGNHGLRIEEPLIFEINAPGRTGIDLPEPPAPTRLGGLERRHLADLPGLSEPQVVRHYTRLSQKNYSIDAGFYPLGSCTMKHNPRLNEAMARLEGFAQAHPFQPPQTAQGTLQMMHTLADWLLRLTGMTRVAMSPAAGAHGELCGIMCIRAALEDRGDARKVVLVPESAHGTNPATAAICGYTVKSIPGDAAGRVDLAALDAALDDTIAAVMITNPNTLGVFERDIITIAEKVHAAGAFVYLDGANFNAIMGRVRPADLGVDAMHINLHKTFSTPHGGGGPGSGPTVLSDALAPYAPVPFVVHDGTGYALVEQVEEAHARGFKPFGRMKGFHGQIGMFVRALSYMMSHGIDGLTQASGDAVLNANYLRSRLARDLSAPYQGLCMHECVFDDGFLKGTGVTTLDLAKALLDEGFHPMTMYFPLVVHGALLIEPTETENKATLDQFANTLLALVDRAKAQGAAAFTGAPWHTPRRRLDETRAARKPVLRYRRPDVALAAE